MNNENTHLQEIQARIDSELWSQKIAQNVSDKYEDQQKQKRILLSIFALILIGFLSVFTYLSPTEFLNSSIVYQDTNLLFMADDFAPIYETMVQEESISTLIEPISFILK